MSAINKHISFDGFEPINPAIFSLAIFQFWFFIAKNINSFLIDKVIKIQNIDEYQINGDFLESQAFGYLAIRSNLKLPISFPNTTRCKKAITGGVIEKNF